MKTHNVDQELAFFVIVVVVAIALLTFFGACRAPTEPVKDEIDCQWFYRTHLDPDDPRRFVRDSVCIA